MYLQQFHAELQILFQVAVVQHVLALVAQIRNQFLTAVRFWEVVELVGREHAPSDVHFFRCERVVVMDFVKMCRILEIHLVYK